MSAHLRQLYTAKILQQSPETKIKALQKVFQSGADAVHVKTSFDKKYFKYVMPGTYLGLVGGMGLFMMMALGKLKRPSKN